MSLKKQTINMNTRLNVTLNYMSAIYEITFSEIKQRFHSAEKRNYPYIESHWKHPFVLIFSFFFFHLFIYVLGVGWGCGFGSTHYSQTHEVIVLFSKSSNHISIVSPTRENNSLADQSIRWTLSLSYIAAYNYHLVIYLLYIVLLWPCLHTWQSKWYVHPGPGK